MSTLDERLARIEGMVAMLVRRTAEAEELDDAVRKAYRRGYINGHHQRRAGRPCDPDAALAARRTTR